MRFFAAALCLLISCAALPAAAADWLREDIAYSGTRSLRVAGDEIVGPFYFDHGKVRFEWTMQGARQISLQRPDRQRIYMIMPDMGVGMEMELSRKNSVPGAEIYADLPAERLGTETLYGETVTKYRVIDDRGAQDNTVTVWVTHDGIPLRLVVSGSQGQFETTLQGLQRGPQAAELFELPEGVQLMPVPQQ